jgi:hypothetical protein
MLKGRTNTYCVLAGCKLPIALFINQLVVVIAGGKSLITALAACAAGAVDLVLERSGETHACGDGLLTCCRLGCVQALLWYNSYDQHSRYSINYDIWNLTHLVVRDLCKHIGVIKAHRRLELAAFATR